MDYLQSLFAQSSPQKDQHRYQVLVIRDFVNRK